MKFAYAALGLILMSARSSLSFAGLMARSTKAQLLFVSRRRTTPMVAFSLARSHHLVGGPLQQRNAYQYRGGAQQQQQPSTTCYSTTALNSAVTSSSDTETTTKKQPVEVFRKDYQPLPFTINRMEMDFDIRDDVTRVTSRMTLAANKVVDTKNASGNNNNNNNNEPLILDGDETCVKLLSLQLDGNDLTPGVDYDLAPGKLILKHAHDGALLTTIVELVPQDNTQLSGLYKSGPMYCTQCEAMGFRRITYYLDRPDNMAVFERVRIEADRQRYPVLLSNGNLVQEGMVASDKKVDNDDDDGNDGNDRHYAIWSDPFPKPSYLFAAVAGNLGCLQDTYTTTSGQHVQLAIYSEHNNVDKLQYAMDSLKRSMKWDEDRFGLEYDLGVYNIVATQDFNMGAMENKGLNIFNTAYVLADKMTATDDDFERVEGVIGHEYFHNWTGNRVTCRDWFQLTLKEGLTVFRDQEFSGDMNSKAVKRIEDVRVLRATQFREDAGPMAHPIRPESYIKMDNFYTATVYIKGAEVIRMYQTILTVDGFNKGIKLYFERHDGSAVTCNDFLAAMADANEVDLSQFSLWYETAGTPNVTYSSSYENGIFSLRLSQESNSDKPLHIPISIGLLDKQTGEEVIPTTVLELKQMSQTFTFENLNGDVVPSILRDFSAPVKLLPESGVLNEADLAFLAARDTDGFNRWESGQRLYTSLILCNIEGQEAQRTLEYVKEAFERTLTDNTTTDYSIQAYALTLPSESTLAEEMTVVDPIAIHEARGFVKKLVAREFQHELMAKYSEMSLALDSEGSVFKVDSESIGKRQLRNVVFEYLCSIKDTDEEEQAAAALAMNHFIKAAGMTDKMAGLQALSSMSGKGAAPRDEAMQRFYDEAEGDALVLNKWFSVQAMADLPDSLDRVKKLKQHKDFTLSNPNRCRSLISSFTANAAAFHDETGEGYKFISATLCELDKLNPQISSKMAGSLVQWRRYGERRGQQMKAELEMLASLELSDDLYEVVNKALN